MREIKKVSVNIKITVAARCGNRYDKGKERTCWHRLKVGDRNEEIYYVKLCADVGGGYRLVRVRGGDTARRGRYAVRAGHAGCRFHCV